MGKSKVIELPVEEFSPKCVLEMYAKESITGPTLKTRKYICKYFFPSMEGNFYFYHKGTFKTYDKATLKTVFFCKFPKEISDWFFNKFIDLYEPVNELLKPRVYDGCVNFCTGFPHSICKYKEEEGDGVKLFCEYMKEVLCSNNEDQYEYLTKWLSVVFNGGKNDSILYLKGIEGIGKSTFSDFIRLHVLSGGISIKTNSEPIKSAYNKELCGKLFVVFEELPTFSANEWNVVSSKIKDMAASETSAYNEKYEPVFYAKNINNYQINTNVDALKNSEGRRYFIMDLSIKRLKDYEYFGKLKKTCFNSKCGAAFFNYIRGISTKGFNSQASMPETEGKLNAIADRLPNEYKFIKFDYIMYHNGINDSVMNVYRKFVSYCTENNVKYGSNIQFTARLREVGLDFKKTGGINKYVYTYDQLFELANKLRWIHELDEFKSKDPSHTKTEIHYDDTSANKWEIDLEMDDKKLKELEEQIRVVKKYKYDKMISEMQKYFPKKEEPKNELVLPELLENKPKKVRTVSNKPTPEVKKVEADILDQILNQNEVKETPKKVKHMTKPKVKKPEPVEEDDGKPMVIDFMN